MKSRRKSVRLCCFFCAVLTGILWLLMWRFSFDSIAAAQETAKEKQTSETADSKAERYLLKKKHDPNGLGKFYMGREIALVMGYPAADWLERPQREEEERLTELVRQLKLKPGQVVADIGAGSGVITLMMAPEVGETGKVLAVDLQQQMLDLLGDKIKNLGITNVELVLANEKSPNLEADSIDLAIMVDVYHEFEYPYETILEISKSLKPGGRVAFVEYRKEDPDVAIKLVHKMTEVQIKKEIGQPDFGLKWKETIRTLPQQHIVMFERPKK